MEISRTEYIGDLRTRMTHLKSGEVVVTDAPTDNQGKGEYFSPTDLVSTALSSCMLTVLGIAARTFDFSIEGAVARVSKFMSAEPPRRISRIVVDLYFPKDDYTEKEKTIIDRVVHTCPVALSLHPDLRQEINLHFGTIA